MRGWLLSPGLPLVLATIGTIGLGYSWYIQNFELVRATEDVSRLERSQLVIDSDEIARDQWLIALDQEIIKQKPDEAFLSAAARAALEGVVRWQTHMMGRVSESGEQYAAELAVRDALFDKAQKLDEAKDYKGLMTLLNRILAASKAQKTTAALDQQYFTNVDAANDRVAGLEREVRNLYFLATAFLLLSTASGSILLEITLRKMAKDTIQVKGAPANRRK
jgi:hypothetical protein